jgi:hypothetical protein
MYKVTYTKPGGRITLESQMKLFSIDRGNIAELDIFYFSARPRLGTQTFKRFDILTIERVPDDAPVYVNHDPRKGKPKETWRYER